MLTRSSPMASRGLYPCSDTGDRPSTSSTTAARHAPACSNADPADESALRDLNQRVITALEVKDTATHMEFIKGRDDGQFYFLEVAARVGGAYISDAIEAATGVNLWTEWARLECTPAGRQYIPPTPRPEYAGVIIWLARQESPDTSAYTDPEIVWRLSKASHVGMIVVSPSASRVESLLDQYAERFATDFVASLPPWTERPPADS